MTAVEDPADRREFDLVLYGATGFTGGLVAEYLARRGMAGSWAIAGRDQLKLERLRQRLTAIDAELATLSIIEASTGDTAALKAMAARARVVISTVGPFVHHGIPVVEACVGAQTHFVDITGEPTYWKEVVERFHDTARESGTIIVPCCGFDSLPHDLGVLSAVRALEPSDAATNVDGYVRGHGAASGGTWNSALDAFAHLRATQRAQGGGLLGQRIHFEPVIERWVLPFPTIDPTVIRRSAELRADYGSEFRYQHWVAMRSLPRLLAIVAGVGVVVAMAQIPPLRRFLARMRPSGDGPSEEARAKHWFEVTVHARRGTSEVIAKVRGGDPGYTETAKMLAESALCLVEVRESLAVEPGRGGVLTPASAFGEVLIERLGQRGIEFEVSPHARSSDGGEITRRRA